MQRQNPSLINAVVWSYWDLVHVVRTDWQSSLYASGLLSIGGVTVLILPVYLTPHPIGQMVARLALLIGLSFLLTTFLIKVHRTLLLGQAAAAADVGWSSPRFQTYFGWLCVFVLAMMIPVFLAALATPTGPIYYSGSYAATPAASFAVLIARIVAVFVLSRVVVVLPAVALDAPGATWQNAFRDMAGSAAFSFALMVLPLIPVGLIVSAPILLLKYLPGSAPGMIAASVWLGISLFVTLTLLAVIVTRLYQLVGDRMNSSHPR